MKLCISNEDEDNQKILWVIVKTYSLLSEMGDFWTVAPQILMDTVAITLLMMGLVKHCLGRGHRYPQKRPGKDSMEVNWLSHSESQSSEFPHLSQALLLSAEWESPAKYLLEQFSQENTTITQSLHSSGETAHLQRPLFPILAFNAEQKVFCVMLPGLWPNKLCSRPCVLSGQIEFTWKL